MVSMGAGREGAGGSRQGAEGAGREQKVGGYPEDMFLDLEETEQEKWSCNIW